MSYKAEYLKKNGWALHSSKKRGMFRIQRWWKSGRGTMSQEEAYNNERSTQAHARLAEAKKDVAEAEAKLAEESTSTTISEAAHLGFGQTPSPSTATN